MNFTQSVHLRSKPNGVRIDTIQRKNGSTQFIVRKRGWIVFDHTVTNRLNQRLLQQAQRAQQQAAHAASTWIHDEIDGTAVDRWKKLEFKSPTRLPIIKRGGIHSKIRACRWCSARRWTGWWLRLTNYSYHYPACSRCAGRLLPRIRHAEQREI